MTDYFVASGGSNTSPYDTWAKAATSLATALTAASSDGDRVIIQHDAVPTANKEASGDTIYTAAAAISIISSTNSGTNTITPAAMGTSNWIGNSTTNTYIMISCVANKTLYIYGVTLRTAGSTADNLYLTYTSGHYIYENCYFWNGNSATTSNITIGTATATDECFVLLRDCTLRFGAPEQRLRTRSGAAALENCTVSSSGSAPTALVGGLSTISGPITFDGCDLSFVNTSLAENQTIGPRHITFKNCKLPTSYIAMNAQTAAGKAGCDVLLLDCHSGDEHIHIGHYNGFGETTVSTGIYANDNIGDSNLSWKVVGTSSSAYSTPYQTPWVEVYHAGTSAITPYLEICRSGSSTAYNNNEVWAEFAYKGSSGSTKASFSGDGMALAGSAAAQTNSSKSASDWTGENATSWFGKIDSGSSITPAEAGHIRARVCVAGANTIYVDPQIRGLA